MKYHLNICYTANQIGHSNQEWQFGYFEQLSYNRSVNSFLKSEHRHNGSQGTVWKGKTRIFLNIHP